jgi:hypothetical protein
VEKAAVEHSPETRGDFMSKQILLEKEELPAEDLTEAAIKTEASSGACPMQGKAWLKGPLGMAICCAAPILLIATISFFGFSLGAIASGTLSLVALLACPVGIFLMMRMMMKQEDQTSRK